MRLAGLRFGVLFSLLLAARCAAAKAWSPDAFPDPTHDAAACGRKGPAVSHVCDPDGLLSRESQNVVDGILMDIQAGTDHYKRHQCGDELVGYQVAVAVMESMDVPGAASPADAARRFATALHDRWRVGHAACSDGVLLLLATADRQIYISTGPGAAAVLPEPTLGRIMDLMKPKLRAGDYGGAVEQGVTDVGLGLAGRNLPEPGREGEGWDWFGVLFFGGVGALIAGQVWKGVKRKREFRNCKRMLEKLKREQAAIRSQHLWARSPQSCPICFEDLAPPPEPSAPPMEGAGGIAGGSASGSMGGEEEAGPSAPLLPSGGASSASAKDAGESSAAAAASAAAAESAAAAWAALSSARTSSNGVSPSGLAALSRLRRRAVGSSSSSSRTGAGLGLGGALPAAGAGTSGAGPSSSSAPAERTPISLACGHTFCEQCLEAWLEKGTTCPVCRKPVAGESPPPAAQQQQQWRGSAAAAGLQQRHGLLDDDWATADMLFRLHMLRLRYPDLISPSMVDQWGTEAATTGSFELGRDFLLHDPGLRHQHHESGSHGWGSGGGGGGGSGWGGGSSYGGGGAGSSW